MGAAAGAIGVAGRGGTTTEKRPDVAKGDAGATLAVLPPAVVASGVGGAAGCSVAGCPTEAGLAAGPAGTVLAEAELPPKADAVSDLKLKGLSDP